METYTITIKGDVRKIIPKINSLLEKERRRLRRQGVHFEVKTEYGLAPTPAPEHNPDILANYL
jgi:hypothetical protein